MKIILFFSVVDLLMMSLHHQPARPPQGITSSIVVTVVINSNSRVNFTPRTHTNRQRNSPKSNESTRSPWKTSTLTCDTHTRMNQNRLRPLALVNTQGTNT